MKWSGPILCLLSLAFMFATFRTYSTFLRVNDSPKIEEGYVASDDGVRLYYQKAGRGEKTLIIPGRLFTFDEFKQLADTFTIISYDMRGRGRSENVADGQKLTIHYDVKDLEAVRRHFRLSKFNAIGYSYLGLMVVMYAMEYPQNVERIVQIGPVPLKYDTKYPAQLTNNDALSETGADPAQIVELERLRASGYDKSHPKEYCEKMWQVFRFRLVGDPMKVDRLGAGTCHMPNEWPMNLERHFKYGFASVQRLNIPKEKVRQVSQPVLTIHGTKDRNAPYGAGREWALMLPDARLLTVEGAAHQVFAEHPDIVFSAIRLFINGRWTNDVEKVTSLERPR